MNLFQSNLSAPAHGRITARRDLVLVALLTALVLTLAIHYELSESVLVVTRRFEHVQLDELVLTLLVLSLGLTWFAWRRYREARAELERRRVAEAQLSRLLLEHRQLAQQH